MAINTESQQLVSVQIKHDNGQIHLKWDNGTSTSHLLPSWLGTHSKGASRKIVKARNRGCRSEAVFAGHGSGCTQELTAAGASSEEYQASQNPSMDGKGAMESHFCLWSYGPLMSARGGKVSFLQRCHP